MRNFGADRALLIDFGVDPRAMETMSLSQMDEMLRALVRRRSKDQMPTKSEEESAMRAFADMVRDDPSVQLEIFD